jgi:archaellum component FlaD/FlaE
MAIDPRNYDLAELRAASGAPVSEPSTGEESTGDGRTAWPGDAVDVGPDGEAEAGERPAAAAAFESAVARDLLAMDRGDEAVERPYLPALPASLAAEALILEWLEYLFLQAGRESVADALSFYETVGWLGADAAEALTAYLSGLNDPQANVENCLDADDHRVSLHYVARLATLDAR